MYDSRMTTDCHGLTFTEGKYWINNDQVDTILTGDNYRQLDVGAGDRAQVGDVAVYRNAAGDPVHSATVTKVDSRGKPTEVEGIGGIQPSSRATTPDNQFVPESATPPGVGYSTITYHRKPNETAQDRNRRVQTVTNFTKR